MSVYVQDGMTALHLVCQQNYFNPHFLPTIPDYEWYSRIRSFIEAGADTEVQDGFGRTAFSYLRTIEMIERANLLVEENRTLRQCIPILK